MNEPTPTPGDHPRVTRLEETLLHTDRSVDRLSEGVDEIMERIRVMSLRLEALEQRMTSIASETQDPGLEPPPHSAGPDIPRDPL